MKRLLLACIILTISIFSFGQTPISYIKPFVGVLTVGSVTTVNDSTWTVVCTFTDVQGFSFTSANIAINNIIVDGKCDFYKVVTINTLSPLNLTIRRIGNTATAPSTGANNISTLSADGMPIPSTGVSSKIRACVEDQNVWYKGSKIVTLEQYMTGNDSIAKTSYANGLTPQYNIPYGDINSLLKFSANLQFNETQLQSLAFKTTGTGGNGYFEFVPQSSAPSTPASGYRQFADASGRFSFRPQSDGFIRTLNGTLTADRVYSLQNSSGTFGLLEATQTWSGDNSFNTRIVLPVTGWPTVYVSNGNNRTLVVGDIAGGSSQSSLLVTGSNSSVDVGTGGSPIYKLRNNIVMQYEAANAMSIGRGWSEIRFYPNNATASPALNVTASNVAVQPASGTTGSSFSVLGTLQYSIPEPKMTTAQRDALTGLTAGAKIFNTTTNRPNYWDGTSWKESIGVASGGLTNTWVGVGDALGNITGSSAFIFSGTLLEVIASGSVVGSRLRNNSAAVNALALTEFVNDNGNYMDLGISSSTYTGTPFIGASNGFIVTPNNGLAITTPNTSGVVKIGINNVEKFRVHNTGYIGINTTNPTSYVHITPSYSSTGNLSGSGYGFRLAAATYNDATTAVSGAASSGAFGSFDGGTLSATNTSITYGDVASLAAVNIPVAGTNVTITRSWAANLGRTLIAGGGSGAFNNPGFSGQPMNLAIVRQAAGSGPDMGIYVNQRQSSAGLTGNIYGILVQNGASSGGTSGVNLIGYGARWTMGQTGTLSMIGYDVDGISIGSFNHPSFIGYRADMGVTGGGAGQAITTSIGLYVKQSTSVSNITNAYGVWIAPYNAASGGVISNRWGIYQEGVGERNVFAGATAFGSISAPVASAIVEMTSTTQGLLIPRMTTAQRDAIATPATGLRIFNTNTLVDNFYTGAAWAEYHVSSNPIVNTNNNQRIGFLQLLSSGSAGTTGQGIVVTGFDQTVQFQGTGASAPANTFTFDTNAGGARGFLNTNPLSSFVNIKGGFTNPNTTNLSASVLSVTPTYNISTHSGATVRGVYYNPTLTSMVGVGTHNAWESSSGNMIITGGVINITGTAEVLFTGTNSSSSTSVGLVAGSGGSAGSGYISLFRNGTTVFTTNGSVFLLAPTTWAGNGGATTTISGGFGAGTLGTSLNLSSNAANAGAFTATSGTQVNVRIGGNNNTWQPSSGTAGFQSLLINPTYNTTGSYVGTARGVYYNPTITSVTGLTHNAWESTSGDFVVNGGRMSIGSSTIPTAIGFQIVANDKMSIPAPVMTSVFRDFMTGIEAGMIYNQTTDEYQFFDASVNSFVGIVKKGADGFFTDQTIIFAANPAGENQVTSSSQFRYNTLTGKMSIQEEFSKIDMRREPSDTDLDAALTVKSEEETSDASYFLRLVKGVDGVGTGVEDSVEISMYDGNLLLAANTKSAILSAPYGYISTEGTPFVQHRTQHNGSGSLQLSGRQNVAFISSSATYTDITLPAISTGFPDPDEARIGQEITIVIQNASSMTIYAGAGTGIVVHGGSTTPAASIPYTGGTLLALKFTAISNNVWAVLGN